MGFAQMGFAQVSFAQVDKSSYSPELCIINRVRTNELLYSFSMFLKTQACGLYLLVCAITNCIRLTVVLKGN